jgi:hypothetical protein
VDGYEHQLLRCGEENSARGAGGRVLTSSDVLVNRGYKEFLILGGRELVDPLLDEYQITMC